MYECLKCGEELGIDDCLYGGHVTCAKCGAINIVDYDEELLDDGDINMYRWVSGLAEDSE